MNFVAALVHGRAWLLAYCMVAELMIDECCTERTTAEELMLKIVPSLTPAPPRSEQAL